MVLKFSSADPAREFWVLVALRKAGLPVPRAWALDADGAHFGIPCLLIQYCEAKPLTVPLLKGRPWARKAFLSSIARMASLPRKVERGLLRSLGSRDVAQELDETYLALRRLSSDPLGPRMYRALKRSMPPAVRPRFDNGDLSPENVLVRGRRLAAMVDFEFAGFRDPFLSFLTAVRSHGALQGKGLEAAFCRRFRLDPSRLPWYRAFVSYRAWFWMTRDRRSSLEDWALEDCRREMEGWRGGEAQS